MWGESTQIFFNYVGIFNPMWLLTVMLNGCGLSFYQAFLFSISFYFWLGQLGFYLLAKTVFQNARAAYFAFILFLFSSVSMSMFAQYHPQLLYIPSIWFFYFLLTFLKQPSRLSWLGITFTAAVILTSYLPFYFLTVLLIIFLFSLIFYSSTIKAAISPSVHFLRANPGLAAFSLGIVVLAFLPGYHAYQSTVNKEIVAPFRNGNVEKKTGVELVDYEKVSKNGISSRMDLEDLYANLDIVQYGDDGFFYLSPFFYLLLILGAGLRINRVMAVCGSVSLLLFFFIMTVGTGFHRFVFEHVPYFKLIRNMHFFLPFFIAALILLATEQFRLYFENRNRLSSQHRGPFFISMSAVHVVIAVFLVGQHNIVLSSYAALGFSFLFWTVFIFGSQNRDTAVLSIFLFLGIIIQPCEVIWRHNQKALKTNFYSNKSLIEDCVRVPSENPVFSYTRPISSRPTGNDDTAYSRIAMKDTSRFFENGFPSFWSYNLTLKEPFEDVQQYTKYKFHLYDGKGLPEGAVDLKASAAVAGPSEQFRVTFFDVNSIKIRTEYPDEKFLVYTDSYQKGWKAWINGEPSAIQRTNMAFKGIHLRPGVNEIEFRYSPPMIAVVSIALSFSLLVMLFILIWIAVKDCNAKNHV